MTAATSSNMVLSSIPPQLVPTLKTLRLGGMQDTLPLRLDQAQQQRLGYLEFLELLLGDEIERRANRALASRLSKAHFEDSDKTFENFDWTFNPKLPQEQLRDLATGGQIARKEHILLCGPAGVGKNASGRRSWPPGSSAGLPGRVRQDQPAVERSGRRARRRHLGRSAAPLPANEASLGPPSARTPSTTTLPIRRA